ncbi:glycoside hydrolase/deacetylase [Aspergillus heteromorphus CBS 117.55]|uniref:Glycoside hydrolase/deacetylase n=1 Tax=Aspergillus heteromorphus CBS 117.55 TaxID=1448321 RepID=A0A317X3V8_9EURO|nr:glycoside hydrolase/deacetylase [Aspergillus heteromorphus CBS 117.55]PWY92861.1 glycoside hydrolase/deacetylase [Aspergillus heteromorphus CBS 117.55]
MGHEGHDDDDAYKHHSTYKLPSNTFFCFHSLFPTPAATQHHELAYDLHHRAHPDPHPQSHHHHHRPPRPPPPFLIDTFTHKTHNALGFWHGALEGLPLTHGPNSIRLSPTDPDQYYHTQLSAATCFNLNPHIHTNQHLHIHLSGSPHFTISLTQNNPSCNASLHPFPETWDSLDASRYAHNNHIYIPLSHFHINSSRTLSIAFGGFYTPESVTLFRVEIVDAAAVPKAFPVPPRLDNGNVALRCSRPGAFAFGIDDGQPGLAQEVMRILEEEGIMVTFFVVGMGLRDAETNFSAVYREMLRRGHQVALHSDTHRKLEGLGSTAEIDREIVENIKSFQQILGIETRYFRPPYGTIGARTRQRLAYYIKDPQIINWSVDIEDWLWAGTKTPEKQREAFIRDVKLGGNLAVMHFLSPTTVSYFREIIQFVKSMNATIMRIDQCLEDPNSPPLKISVP